MKKVSVYRSFILLLIVVFALSVLSGCGGSITPVASPGVTASPMQSAIPSAAPTAAPSASAEPSAAPKPSAAPEPTVEPTPEPSPDTTPPPTEGPYQEGSIDEKRVPDPVEHADGSVTVYSLEQLLDALEPGKTIRLAEGKYNVSRYYEATKAISGADLWNEDAYWSFQWDALYFRNLQDTTICAEEGADVELITEDAYAAVLGMEYCDHVELKGLTMGHAVEPGRCTGDVLALSYCSGVSLSELDLYGCGTYGINADHCLSVFAEDCVIRECSYGIVHGYLCEDVVFQHCTLRDCSGYEQLDLYNTQAAFLNCDFIGNRGTFGFLSTADTNDILFDGCSFDDWEKEQLEVQLPTLSHVVIADSSYVDNRMQLCLPSTLEEFVESIQPHTRIELSKLDAGTYDLSAYLEKVWSEEGEAWNTRHKYVQIVDCFDGLELYVKNVDGLSIIGECSERLPLYEFTVDPRYASVFNFIDCSDLKIFGLTLGHTEIGECFGNVLLFNNCQNVILDSLDIYGCGFYGVSAEGNSSDFTVCRCTIRDCSAGPYCIEYCSGYFHFIDCILTGSSGGGSYWGTDSSLYFLYCCFGDHETTALFFRDDYDAEMCSWSDNITEYPDYG